MAHRAEGGLALRAERVWFWLTLLAIATGAFMRRAALSGPLVADDFAQRAMLHGRYPVHRWPLDLYNFADGTAAETRALVDGGSLPWWSHPHIKYALLRPLSSALLWLDDRLFGMSSFAAHAHSLLWWSLASGAVAWLLRCVLPARAAAIATLLFVLDEAHTWPVAWLANRNALVTVAFAGLGLRAYVRWREHDTWRDGLLAGLAFALSCTGGEMAICFAAYVVAFEIVAGRGWVVRRALGLAPALLPFALYAFAYRMLGRGAFGSDVYLDPVSEPAAYARAALPRVLALLSDLLAGTPAEGWNTHGSIRPIARVVAPAAIVALLAFVWAVRRLEPRAAAHARWLALGAPFAILPMAASFVGTRLLLPAEVGACAAFATIIEGALRAASERGRGPMLFMARCLGLYAAGAVVYVHVKVAAHRSRAEIALWKHYQTAFDEAVLNAEIDPRRLDSSTVVLLSAADPPTALYVPSVWQASGMGCPERWRVLSMAPGFHLVIRVDDRTLDMAPYIGAFLTSSFETLFRSARLPMHVGDVTRVEGMTVTIQAVGPRGPRVVRFAFDRSLDSPTMMLLVAENGELRQFHPPAIGMAAVIAPATVPQSRSP